MSTRPKTFEELMNHAMFRNMMGEAIHNIWIEWSKAIAKEEQLTPDRLKRWRELWIPFDQLEPEFQEIDRKYGDQILAVMKEYLTKVARRMY